MRPRPGTGIHPWRVGERRHHREGCRPGRGQNGSGCPTLPHRHPLDDLSVPADIAFLVALWRLRYLPGLRNLAELFLARGFAFSHATIRTWEALVASSVAERRRARRRGQASRRWHAGETYSKYTVFGATCMALSPYTRETGHQRERAVTPAGRWGRRLSV